MAEIKDAHIVEIPVDKEHQQKVICAMNAISAIQQDPLTEISQSPGHFLLLKLWQREDDIFGRRIAMKEKRMDSIRREIFQLCCFFFIFHGIFLTVKLYRYWKVDRQLQRERADGRALTRCIQELRMKGESFDLSTEPQIGKRMKSSSIHPLCLNSRDQPEEIKIREYSSYFSPFLTRDEALWSDNSTNS
ncbi:Hypothetical predicted protein [Olea europaea subsp. europaea]|uniref:Uncharacterized protein n=1 Tax=Olea europaea subsp. europaea TaxID=158383 RepID=A0A8S0TPB5_OLEEU|nr:Hypothetical predicted protein [Olea europaea subsp. europaea]